MIEDWIQSYACFEEKKFNRIFKKAMKKMLFYADKEEFKIKLFTFKISEEKL